MADSGAIFTTLAPFPLHSDLMPPSFTIIVKPDEIDILFLLDACTYKKPICVINCMLNQEGFCAGPSSNILILINNIYH